MRLLVVEDEPLLADAVAKWLPGRARCGRGARRGAALEWIGVHDYDVVVLDRDLPVVRGDDVCRAALVSESPVRVLMLTRRRGSRGPGVGLVLGADDDPRTAAQVG